MSYDANKTRAVEIQDDNYRITSKTDNNNTKILWKSVKHQTEQTN
jgi:hypothetical protein